MQDCRARAVTRLSNGKVERQTFEDRAPVVIPDRSGPWVPRLIETLCEFKRLGLEFEFAWRIALRQHPPQIIELGPRHDPTALERYHDVCLNAWFDLPRKDGTPSRLRGLGEALEGGFLPAEDMPVRRVRPHRVNL